MGNHVHGQQTPWGITEIRDNNGENNVGMRVVWYGDRVQERFRKEMTRRVRQAVTEVERQVKQNISAPVRVASLGRAAGASGLAGEFPRALRSVLIKSIFSDMVDDSTGIIGVDAASPARKYAKRLEDGGEIRSHGKMMAVPISPAAKRHSLTGGPRTFERPLKLIKRPGKPPLLVEIPQARGAPSERKAWIIHYVLTPRVIIAQHSYLARTTREMIPRIKSIFEAPFAI